VTIFGRSKIGKPRLYRGQDRSIFAQSTRNAACHFLFIAVAAILNLLSIAGADADILNANDLKKNLGPSVIRIETGGGAGRIIRGFGVIISPQGHVLTAAHVIQGLASNAIRGRAPWKDSNTLNLTVIDKNEDPRIDLALLQIQGPFDASCAPRVTPTACASLVHEPDLTLGRVLTGSLGVPDELVSLDATLTINKNAIMEAKGFLNSGVSGSPLFNHSGNLVGIIVEGISGENTIYVRPLSTIKEFLKDKPVGFNEVPSAPVMISIYFWISSYASSSATDVKTNVIAPLTVALSKSLKDQLTPAPEVVTDSKSLGKWSEVASALFNEEALPREKRLEKANQQLADPEFQGWLRKMAFSQLYLLVVRIEKEEGLGFSNLRPVLLILTQQGDKVDLEYVVDPEAKLTIYPPPDFRRDIPNEPFGLMQDSLAVELMHIIVRKRPSFARNNRIFADCIRFPGLDYTKNDRVYYAPYNLETKLAAVFEAKQVKVKSASEQTCREAIARNTPRYLWPDHLNEYIVGATISGKDVHWQAGHPWDKEEDRPKEETKSEADPDGSDYIEPTVGALATDIDRKWSQILNKINSATR
jgi:hypothetical protein